MGLGLGKVLKKAVKGVVKVHKKAFGFVKKTVKKLWENKWTRMAIIAGVVIAGGAALAAANGGAAAGAGAGVTGSSSAVGASSAAGAGSAVGTGTVLAPGAASAAGVSTGVTAGAGAGGGTIGLATAPGSITTALAPAGAGTVAAPASSGLLAQAGSALSSAGATLAANPTATLVGGMGLMNMMQARQAEAEADKQRAYEEEQRNKQTAYGVSYDGKTDVAMNSGDKLMELNNKYRQRMIDPNAAAGAGLMKRTDPYKMNGVA